LRVTVAPARDAATATAVLTAHLNNCVEHALTTGKLA
jgi:hypothetical protein